MSSVSFIKLYYIMCILSMLSALLLLQILLQTYYSCWLASKFLKVLANLLANAN